MQRTDYCGKFSSKDIGKKVIVCGWVHSRRDHGGVVFIDLRDREGLLQIVFHPDKKDIFSFEYEDFTLEGYDPHPGIKAPIAI